MDEEKGNSLEVLDLDVDASKASINPQLIGKIMSDSMLIIGKGEPLIRDWESIYHTKVHITHIGDNLYLFTFEDAESAEDVLQDGPWKVMEHFLCLERWGTQMSLDEVRLTHVPIWVQIHGLMLDQMTDRNAEFIGSHIGVFLKVDCQSLNNGRKLGYVRIKVFLDCSTIVKFNMWVTRQGEMKYRILFIYENLAIYCYHCGRFGHMERECKNKGHPHRKLFACRPCLTVSTPYYSEMKHAGKARNNKFQTNKSHGAVVEIRDIENKDNCNNETDKLLPRMEKSKDKECGPRESDYKRTLTKSAFPSSRLVMDKEKGNGREVLDLEVDASASKASINSQLIGKIIADTAISMVEAPIICYEWDLKYHTRVQVTQLGDNIYIFTFENAETAENVFQNETWKVWGRFLCLERWGTQMSLDKVRLTHVPIWVQVHGLMLDQMTERNSKFIGDYIGVFLKVDRQSLDDGQKLGFIRIKVLLDCSAVVKANMRVSRPGEIKYQIEFRYEELPLFCYNCGRFGHFEIECKDEGRPHRDLFGPWLSVSTPYHSKMKHKGKARNNKFQTNGSHDVVVDIIDTEKRDSWNNETDKLLPRMDKSEDDKLCTPCESNKESVIDHVPECICNISPLLIMVLLMFFYIQILLYFS